MHVVHRFYLNYYFEKANQNHSQFVFLSTMNAFYSPYPTMKKVGALTRIQTISTRDDRMNPYFKNEEKSCSRVYSDDDEGGSDNVTTSDVTSCLKPSLRQSIHSFQSSELSCSGEMKPPKYPHRRFNSIDNMDFIEVEGAKKSIEPNEASSSFLENFTMNSTIDSQLEHCPAQLSLIPLLSYSLIGMEIIIHHDDLNDNATKNTSSGNAIKQKHDIVPHSPRRMY